MVLLFASGFARISECPHQHVRCRIIQHSQLNTLQTRRMPRGTYETLVRISLILQTQQTCFHQKFLKSLTNLINVSIYLFEHAWFAALLYTTNAVDEQPQELFGWSAARYPWRVRSHRSEIKHRKRANLVCLWLNFQKNRVMAPLRLGDAWPQKRWLT